MKIAIAKGLPLCGLVALALALTANVASAQLIPYKPVVVHYSDLDLSRSPDVQRLYGRIKRAANMACGGRPAVDLERIRAFEQCSDLAITNAVASVKSAQLTDFHQAEMHRASRG